MSALTKLLGINSKLPIELRAEHFLLTSELIKEFIQEKINLIDDYERIIRAMQDTKPYDVVAIAGTAETLLSNPIQTIEGC